MIDSWPASVMALAVSSLGRLAVDSASAKVVWPLITATVELILLVAVVVLYAELRKGEVPAHAPEEGGP